MLKSTRAKFEINPETKIPRKGKAVICITTGQIFKSAREAADYFGFEYTGVAAACGGKIRHSHAGKGKTTGGLLFCYVCDLAYVANDIAEYISDLRDKACKAEEYASKISLMKEESKNIKMALIDEIKEKLLEA